MLGALMSVVFVFEHDPDPSVAPNALWRAALAGLAEPWEQLKQIGTTRLTLETAHRVLVASAFGLFSLLVIARLGAVCLSGWSPRPRLRDAAGFALRRFHRAPVSWLLVALPGLLAFGIAWLVSWPILWPVPVLFSVAAAVGLLMAAASAPLAIAAVAVDDADPFDAASRSAAYAMQLLGHLGFYLLLAAVIGFSAAIFLEFVIALQWRLTVAIVGQPDVGLPFMLLQAIVGAMRGFYIAYWVVATTAIYLLLRHDIDGQPLDEIALPKDQPSAEA